MGVLDYFSKEAAAGRRRARCAKKLGNMYYQSVDRIDAANLAAKMAQEGDAESIRVLLIRFEHLAPSTVNDRDEKEHVLDLLVDLGDAAIPVIEKYVRETPKPVYWPLRALAELWPPERYEDFYAELLEGMTAEYVRFREKKAMLVQGAIDHKSERIGRALLPFVGDQNEGVRFNAVETLLQHGFELARPALLDALAGEESQRIINRLVDAFVERHWSVAERQDVVAARLPEGIVVTGKSTLARRNA